jgi:ParB-like chromosome segregation protein Spo0J
MKYRIADIVVGDRKRELGDTSHLAQSIKELGLLNPITIKADRTLVAGCHRLSACKALGWEEIEVNIVELDKLDAELAEIDENLIRNELHWLDRDKQIARRKQIYEEKDNILKHGGDRKSILPQIAKSKPNNSDLISSFTADTAKKIGRSVDTVEQSVRRAKAFTEDQGKVLKRANVPQTDAMKLARLEEPKREAVIQKLAEAPKPMKVKDAIAVVKREERAEKAKAIVLPQDMQLIEGDFLEVGRQIADNSVGLIFTDPPYHEKHLELWSNLGSFAARVLKPGGILLAYSGQIALPQVLNALSEHLDYCWLLGQFHKGQHIQIWKYQIWNEWKPLVLFSKGKPVLSDWFIDAYDGVKGDKEAHEWAQGEDEAQYFIQKLTQPGDLVVDPMCGSGPIVRMAHRFKRHSIGIEIDKQRYDVALGSMEVLTEA